MYTFRRLLWEECIVDGQEREERPVSRLSPSEKMMVSEPDTDLGIHEWS